MKEMYINYLILGFTIFAAFILIFGSEIITTILMAIIFFILGGLIEAGRAIIVNRNKQKKNSCELEKGIYKNGCCTRVGPKILINWDEVDQDLHTRIFNLEDLEKNLSKD